MRGGAGRPPRPSIRLSLAGSHRKRSGAEWSCQTIIPDDFLFAENRPGTSTLGLVGDYMLYFQAVGKASITNNMSITGVSYKVP